MGKRKERIEQAEFVNDVESGGVHGVAPEIAQEVGMFLEDVHIDASACEQIAQHHTRRPATGDAASGVYLFIISHLGYVNHGRQYRAEWQFCMQ